MKPSTQHILDEILAQLEKRGDVLMGVEATLTIKELAYRQGKFVAKSVKMEQHILGKEQLLGDVIDPADILTGSERILEELPSSQQNLIRIRAKPAKPAKFNLTSLEWLEDDNAMTEILTISKAPVRLLKMKMLFVKFPWWVNL